jgi:hypothetical protein
MGVKGKEVYTKIPNYFPEEEGFPLFIDFGSKYPGPMGSNLYRLLKNAPAYQQAGIRGVPLILPLVKHGAGLLRLTP